MSLLANFSRTKKKGLKMSTKTHPIDRIPLLRSTNLDDSE
jgi:hypothetical protein